MANASWVLVPGQNGQLQQTGCLCDRHGNITPTGKMSQNFNGNMSPSVARQKGYTVLNAQQLSQALQVKSGQSGDLVSSQFIATDVPNVGPVALSRMETPGGINGAGVTYTIILDNTQPLSVADYKLFGDIAGTYQIAQNLVPTPGSTLVVGGSAGTASLTHLTQRAGFRPFKITSMQIKALNENYFTQQPISYFNTTPSPKSGVDTHQLGLSALLNADQNNPTIQTYDVSELYDGINGLRFDVPRLEYLVITLTIVSESSAHSMSLLS